LYITPVNSFIILDPGVNVISGDPRFARQTAHIGLGYKSFPVTSHWLIYRSISDEGKKFIALTPGVIL